MAYVITEPCVATCDTACVKACPVDAIAGPFDPLALERLPPVEQAARKQGLQLYIDPNQCICCAACEPECPVGAIFDEDAVPARYRRYVEINAAFFRRAA